MTAVRTGARLQEAVNEDGVPVLEHWILGHGAVLSRGSETATMRRVWSSWLSLEMRARPE